MGDIVAPTVEFTALHFKASQVGWYDGLRLAVCRRRVAPQDMNAVKAAMPDVPVPASIDCPALEMFYWNKNDDHPYTLIVGLAQVVDATGRQMDGELVVAGHHMKGYAERLFDPTVDPDNLEGFLFYCTVPCADAARRQEIFARCEALPQGNPVDDFPKACPLPWLADNTKPVQYRTTPGGFEPING